MKEHEIALQKFFETRPADQILEQKLSKSMKEKDPHKPPHFPMTPLSLFVAERFKNLPPDTKEPALVKNASEEFEALPSLKKMVLEGFSFFGFPAASVTPLCPALFLSFFIIQAYQIKSEEQTRNFGESWEKYRMKMKAMLAKDQEKTAKKGGDAAAGGATTRKRRAKSHLEE